MLRSSSDPIFLVIEAERERQVISVAMPGRRLQLLMYFCVWSGKCFVSKCSIAPDLKIAVGLPVTVLPASHHTCFNVRYVSLPLFRG
jgi:hypothetical protein